MMYRLLAATITAATLFAQAPAVFNAASLKPAASGIPGARVQFRTGRITGRNVTARTMILAAYHLTPYQLAGGPGWLDSDRFDLDANTEAPAGRDQLRLMLRGLLADRLKLMLHQTTKDMPIYELTVAKKGKLVEWQDGASMPAARGGAPSASGGRRGGGSSVGGGMLVDRLTMQAFAEMLSTDSRVGRPVIDMTGLQGTYLISFRWESDDDFVNAIEESLGLQFKARRAPIDVFTIDHVEKPTAN
jgi:uncharacterized protein (TIGR03435 family)